MTSRLAVLAVLLVVLAGCGDDEPDLVQSDLERAEANVAAKEQALTDAQASADEAVAEFCGDAKTYIDALDRYGDLLASTAPTVGDVTDAGSDLVEPEDDVTEAGEEAVAAQADLLTAQQDLKEARAELKEINATSTPSTSPSESATSKPKVKATPYPMPPSDAVNRVKQAQKEFEATKAGITDRTPLVQASEQFNAAVVALEMSWLHLFAASGCLTDEQQKQAEAAVQAYTLILQNSLAEAGYYAGPVDGIYGPETVKAVESLQQAHDLPVTGAVDKATADALAADLDAKGGDAAAEALATTAAVQQTLKLAGFWDGPIDGEWTPALTQALMSFQTALGVEPTGTVDAATIAAVENAIATAREPEPTPSETPAETPSETAPAESPTPTAEESADE